MNRRRRPWIGIFLMLLVLWSGLYIKEYQIAPERNEVSARAYDAYVIAGLSVGDEDRACTTEMLGIRGSTELAGRAASFGGQRREMEVFCGSPSMNLYPLTDPENSVGVRRTQQVTGGQGKNVVIYIHKMDGKKEMDPELLHIS